MKKSLIVILSLLLLLSLCGCGGGAYESGEGEISIIATGFPSFDFARNIGGERVKVTMLVPPGAETHSFEPTPQDIIRIENCDLIICTGGHGEAWLDTMLEGQSLVKPKITMLDCVEGLEKEVKEGMQQVHHHHHHHEFDEHVWTSPVNAMTICRSICAELIALDPEGASYYKANLENYTEKLKELDASFRKIVSEAKSDTLIFADRFPVRYFVEEYGLDYYAAFPGCADDVEPSAKTVAFLIDMVRENHVPAVLHIEFSNEKMADIICEDTGCKKLLFHSCHNVTRKELDEGISYLQLMENNLSSVKEALG